MKTSLQCIAISLAILFQTGVALAEIGESTDQMTREKTLEIIPVIGATSFSMANFETEHSSKGGSMAGVLAGYNLGLWDSSLESGLMYMETGFSQNTFFFGSIDTTIQYVSIPILWRVPLFEVGSVKMHTRSGVHGAFKVGANTKGSGLFEGIEEQDNSSRVNSFDALGQIGLGGSYRLSEGFDLQADLAYLRGFTKVFKDEGGQNTGLSLSLSLAIAI